VAPTNNNEQTLRRLVIISHLLRVFICRPPVKNLFAASQPDVQAAGLILAIKDE
jgi:hypothetical protein